MLTRIHLYPIIGVEAENMHEVVDEQVGASVWFTGREMKLRAFFWKNRTYGVDNTHMIHKVRNGSEWLYFYAVTSGATSYRLCFSTSALQWKLVDLYADG
jgi:hypothetical protein